MKKFISLAFGLIVLAFILFQIPFVERNLSWRLDVLQTYLRVMFSPIGALPPPQKTLPPPLVTIKNTTPSGQAAPSSPSTQEMTESQPPPSPQPTPTLEPLPRSVSLPSPSFETQDWNNCGPVALSMFLRFYGWQGDQFDIADSVKPFRADRNVNIDELAGFVTQNTDNLAAVYRVGGDLLLLKQLLAAGFPVMIEETYYLEKPFWYRDDLWAGHYLLLTGYDDDKKVFTSQDSFFGPDRQVPFATLDKNWQAFNRVFLLVYPPDKESEIINILGPNWERDSNRQAALETAINEAGADPQDPFPWFNLGSNLVYFERYEEASRAYDTARTLVLPQRMLRYQFGPFLAYFHSGRLDDLESLVAYALKATPNSEEALLWQGWAAYRRGQKGNSLVSFQHALENHPGYPDAEYARTYVQNN